VTALPAFESLDAVQRWALRAALEQGSVSTPRGAKTLELIGAGFSLTQPRRRCIAMPERRWSLPLAIGEFSWHVSGSDELSFIAYYAPRWREFSSDNAKIEGSCYGKRVFQRDVNGGESNWDRLIHLLRMDPESRRAILNFQQSPAEALDPTSKDVACASTLQFFVRSNALHALAYMRSNDIVLGLPYDVFLFTMLQELLAQTLNLNLGTYHHFAGSLHLYGRHFDLAERVLASPEPPVFEMPPMGSIDELPDFLKAERLLRLGTDADRTRLSPYWQELAAVLAFYRSLREDTLTSSDLRLSDSMYGMILRPLIVGRQ